jgi:hypothetical protein
MRPHKGTNATERSGIEPFMTTSTALTTNSTPEEPVRRRAGNRGPVAFKQREGTRLMRAAKEAGLTVTGIEYGNGTLRVLTAEAAVPRPAINDWDEVLSDAALSKRSA